MVGVEDPQGTELPGEPFAVGRRVGDDPRYPFAGTRTELRGGTRNVDATQLDDGAVPPPDGARWMVVAVDARVPDPDQEKDPVRRDAMEKALVYMDLKPNTPIEDIRIDKVFIGSCTNSRIEDLRAAAEVVRGKQRASNVKLAMVVPGSGLVKDQAEREGLDRIFKDAGFEWREPGCSMCLAMNADRLEPGERCASTSNRNFEGRQGAGGRTHLVSPAMAAAAAVTVLGVMAPWTPPVWALPVFRRRPADWCASTGRSACVLRTGWRAGRPRHRHPGPSTCRALRAAPGRTAAPPGTGSADRRRPRRSSEGGFHVGAKVGVAREVLDERRRLDRAPARDGTMRAMPHAPAWPECPGPADGPVAPRPGPARPVHRPRRAAGPRQDRASSGASMFIQRLDQVIIPPDA